jgi:hypothetical protein
VRIDLVQVPRFSRALLVMAGVVGLWGVAVLALHAAGGSAFPLCRFRALTGLPCPTCGGTRGTAALLRGDVAGSFAANPLLMSVLAVTALVLVVRAATGLTPALRTRPGEGRYVLAAALTLVVLDWAYLVAVGR